MSLSFLQALQDAFIVPDYLHGLLDQMKHDLRRKSSGFRVWLLGKAVSVVD